MCICISRVYRLLNMYESIHGSSIFKNYSCNRERENISEQFACFIENLKVCNDCCFGVVKGLF